MLLDIVAMLCCVDIGECCGIMPGLLVDIFMLLACVDMLECGIFELVVTLGIKFCNVEC